MKINMRQDFSNRNSSFIFLLREYVQGFQRSRIIVRGSFYLLERLFSIDGIPFLIPYDRSCLLVQILMVQEIIFGIIIFLNQSQVIAVEGNRKLIIIKD